MSNDTKAYFCPSCGSPLVEVSQIVGGTSKCNACTWSGSSTDLVVHHFEQNIGSDEEVMMAFTHDIKKVFAESMSLPMAQVLMKWGFFKGKPQPKELTRYLVAAAKAAIKALITEHTLIEQERVKEDASRRN